MPKKLDGFYLLSTEENGYNKEQVAGYIAYILNEYEKLYNSNMRLKKQVKSLKSELESKA